MDAVVDADGDETLCCCWSWLLAACTSKGWIARGAAVGPAVGLLGPAVVAARSLVVCHFQRGLSALAACGRESPIRAS